MARASNVGDVPAEPAAALRYMPQLDALRALAVLGVMIHHFWPEAEDAVGLTLGYLGVQLFFVLSGFLITGILLRGRDVTESHGQSTALTIRQFYIRRFLRLVPAFYATLAVAWIFGLPEVRDSLLWHLTYTSNVYFVWLGDWYGSVSHFWSLAVEEQFYLAWPFAIILTPRRLLLPMLAAVVALAPAFRWFGAATDLPWIVGFVLPFGNCDALAIGAILASASAVRQRHSGLRSRLVGVGFWMGAPLVLALWFLQWKQLSWPASSWFRTGLENTVWALFFMWLVDGAARGFGGPVGRLFERAPLTYLGKISYGIYLIHPFMARVVPWAYAHLGARYPTTHLLRFLVLAAATVFVAALSWHVYERPLNDLKRYFRSPDARKGYSQRLAAGC